MGAPSLPLREICGFSRLGQLLDPGLENPAVVIKPATDTAKDIPFHMPRIRQHRRDAVAQCRWNLRKGANVFDFRPAGSGRGADLSCVFQEKAEAWGNGLKAILLETIHPS